MSPYVYTILALFLLIACTAARTPWVGALLSMLVLTLAFTVSLLGPGG